MQAAQNLEHLKGKMREMWMAGDFGQIAKWAAAGAAEFVDTLPIERGTRVLDVACGTGNLAIPAARKGGQVTGVDHAPNLLAQAQGRAAVEGLQIAFDEGDAERLPYRDGQFDVVMSMFGAMFAPRPDVIAAELARVCRSGGTMAMANWTPGGFVAKSSALNAKYVPPPEGLPSPFLWGDEEAVRNRLEPWSSKITTERRRLLFDQAVPPRGVVEFFREHFGPTKVTFARLDAAGQATLAADLETLWRQHNQAEGNRTVIHNEYLAVYAVRR